VEGEMMAWKVTLIKSPQHENGFKVGIFAPTYFPRIVDSKREAFDLKRQVEEANGKALALKVKK
jgi:hypothetical protein